MMRRHRKRAGAGHVLLVALLPILLLYTVVALLRLPLVPDLGFQSRQFEVTDITPGGPADHAGLRPGDEVLRMQGIHQDDMMGILRAFGTFRPGDRILFQVDRGGTTEHFEVIAAERSPELRLRIAIRSLVGLAFVVLGFIVFWNRNDIVASLFYFGGITLGFLLIEPPPTGSILLQFAIKTAADFAILFAAPVILHLFLRFPRKKAIPAMLAFLGPVTVFGRRIPCGLYVVSAIFFTMSLSLNITIYFTGNLHRALLSFFQFISALYMFLCILAGVGAFLHSYRTTNSRVMKRKLRGVAWGTSLALLPFAFTNVYKLIRPEGEIFAGPYFVLLILLLPLSFGHAIVRYGLLDLEIIVKRSMLYTILTAFLAVAYIGLVDLVGRLVRNVSGGTDILPSILTIFLIALLFSPARNLIQDWIDRTFFREKFQYRRTLHEFSQALTSILDLKTLLRVLVRRISQTLHVNRVAVFLKDEATGSLVLQEAAGVAREATGAEPITFHGDDKIVRFLEGSHRAVPIDRVADGEGTILLPESEKSRLAELDSSLLIPLISGDRLTGIVSLGPKESGEVYSREDRELLNTLANQATLAIENAQLHRETIDRERMKQELELAREIQLQLLPPSAPELPGIDIASLYVISEEVGGDYYDYVPGPDGALGLVVADAIGHGVSAALLISSVQASFRAEARISSSPASSLEKVNRQMQERNTSGRFVTIFYCVLDPVGGVLTYANAGHPPPVVVHADGTHHDLDESDLILGVDASVSYREHHFPLAHDDVLVLFTDGITDEPNAHDRSFGRERLTEIVREHRGGSATEICDTLHRAVIRFLGENPTDDLTLIVLKYANDACS